MSCVLSLTYDLFLSDGMDKHMFEPMIITLTDLSLAVFCNCFGYLEILVKYVEFFKGYTVIACQFF